MRWPRELAGDGAVVRRSVLAREEDIVAKGEEEGGGY